MTLSFATSPFSSTRDFLFASDAVDPVQSFIDRRWYNIVRLVTLRIFLQVLEGSVNLLDSMCEDEVLTSTLISMLSCWGSMLRNLAPGSAGTMSHKFFIWCKRFRWVSIMPFNVPLVPLVYISVATSSGVIVSKISCWPDKWETTIV